ncbi:MAG: hypothetical protein IRZ00_10795 [Gemmatimonadetes bacterium]|nr:hypothetical protein [Gemmatimonadota bacterium]
MSPKEFLALCEREGRGSLLWYDLNGANRPLWPALGMATLLRAGYRFHLGEVIAPIPPP